MADALDRMRLSFAQSAQEADRKAQVEREKKELQSQIEEASMAVRRQTVAVGELVYDLWIRGQSGDAALDALLRDIQQKKDSIPQLQHALASIDAREEQYRQEKEAAEKIRQAALKAQEAERQAQEAQRLADLKAQEAQRQAEEAQRRAREAEERARLAAQQAAQEAAAAKQPESQGITCSRCGAVYAVPVNFCRSCGMDLRK